MSFVKAIYGPIYAVQPITRATCKDCRTWKMSCLIGWYWLAIHVWKIKLTRVICCDIIAVPPGGRCPYSQHVITKDHAWFNNYAASQNEVLCIHKYVLDIEILFYISTIYLQRIWIFGYLTGTFKMQLKPVTTLIKSQITLSFFDKFCGIEIQFFIKFFILILAMWSIGLLYILESHVLVYFKSIYNYSVATTTIQSSHVILEKVRLVTKI